MNGVAYGPESDSSITTTTTTPTTNPTISKLSFLWQNLSESRVINEFLCNTLRVQIVNIVEWWLMMNYDWCVLLRDTTASHRQKWTSVFTVISVVGSTRSCQPPAVCWRYITTHLYALLQSSKTQWILSTDWPLQMSYFPSSCLAFPPFHTPFPSFYHLRYLFLPLFPFFFSLFFIHMDSSTAERFAVLFHAEIPESDVHTTSICCWLS